MLVPDLHSRFVHLAEHWRERIFHCSNPQCVNTHRTWRRLANGARSLHFDGLRYCFPECFELRLRKRFIEMQAPTVGNTRPPRRVPLGLLMLSRGHLDNTQLRRALEAQQQNGNGKIGEWIQKFGFAQELQVTAALAVQWSCPVLKRLPQRISQHSIPLALLRHFRMAPVQFVGTSRVFHLAFAGNIEYPVLVAIEQMLQCKTEACLTTQGEVDSALERIEAQCEGREKAFEMVRLPEDLVRITSSYAVQLNALHVRATACGEFIWVRINSEGNTATDLVFSQV
jgi:hypothetical protein